MVLLGTTGAMAQEADRAFVDLYGGVTALFESDVPDWSFNDVVRTIGGRAGVWIRPNFGLALRMWWFQTNAKQANVSPSDLASLGFSLEMMGRWRFADRWALYGSLGPALLVNTLDLARPDNEKIEDDARSLSPGVSGGVGIEFSILRHLRAFGEIQGSLVYAKFEYPDRTITPRLGNLYGLVGVRVPF